MTQRIWPCFVMVVFCSLRGEVINGGFGLLLDGSQVRVCNILHKFYL